MSIVGAVKRANAKGPSEESTVFRLAVAISVLAAASAMLAQGVGGPFLRLSATLGIAGGMVYSHVARHRDGYVLKAGLAVGVLLAFGDFLSVTGSVGGVTGLNTMQVPLAELFLWVQVLHSLDVPARRDLLFSLLSSLVLIGVAGVLSVSSNLGPYLLVWSVAAIAGLVLAHRSELRDRPALELLPLAVEAPSAAISRRARPAVSLVALVLAAALGMFLLLPAAGAGRAVAFPTALPDNLPIPRQGGLANPSLGGNDPSSPDGSRSSTGSGASASGYFGFADKMDTGARGRPDDTLVMRVRASRPDFWRGQTFDTWDGRTWSQRDQRVQPTGGAMPVDLLGAPEDRTLASDRPDFVQTVYVEAGGPNLIFAAYAPKRLYFSDRRVFEMSDGTVRTGVQLPEGAVYTVVSEREAVTEERLRDSGAGNWGPDLPPLVARYTQLPRGVPDRVHALADELWASAPNRYDFVRAAEAWMAANTTYTLDIPPLPSGADAVDRFLFVDRQGFCEQIASALVVMLRSQGIPARLAVGYAPGQRNPFTGMWEVRARDAHAWAEVWFPGIGWQPFDPTAEVPFAGDPFSSSAANGLGQYLRSLVDVPAGVRQVVMVTLMVAFPVGALGWLALAIARRRREEARRPWSDRALSRLERLGATHGRSRRAWETPGDYASTLAISVLPDERVRRIAALVEADAFAPGPPDPARRAEADELLTELESASSST